MNFNRSSRRGLTAALFAFAAACSDTTGPEVRIPARLDVVGGDGQVATAGTELPDPLVVRVVDEDGRPVRGQLVNFRVAAGGGTVFAGAAQTSSDGIAQERWTLGTVAADSQRVEVRAVDPETGDALVFGVFRATATAGAPASLVRVGAAAKTGFAGALVTDSPAVRVTDQYGNPVAGVAVAWEANLGSTVGAATIPTNAAGLSTAAWTLATRVDTTYSVTASSGALGSAQFTASAGVQPGSDLHKTSGDGQTIQVGSAFAPLVVTLKLADGRSVQGAEITWSAHGYAPVVSRTAANGTASLVLSTGTRPADETWTATFAGAAVSFTVRRVPGPVTRLIKLKALPFYYTNPELGPLVGTTIDSLNTGVEARDAYDNPVPGAVVSFSITAGNGSVSPGQATTDSTGTARTSFTLGTVALAQNEVTMSSGAATPLTVQVRPFSGPVAVVELSADTVELNVGSTAQITGRAWDAFGNEIRPNEVVYTGWTFGTTDANVATAPWNPYSNLDYVIVRGVAPGTTTVTGRFYHRGVYATATTVVIVR